MFSCNTCTNQLGELLRSLTDGLKSLAEAGPSLMRSVRRGKDNIRACVLKLRN